MKPQRPPFVLVAAVMGLYLLLAARVTVQRQLVGAGTSSTMLGIAWVAAAALSAYLILYGQRDEYLETVVLYVGAAVFGSLYGLSLAVLGATPREPERVALSTLSCAIAYALGFVIAGIFLFYPGQLLNRGLQDAVGVRIALLLASTVSGAVGGAVAGSVASFARSNLVRRPGLPSTLSKKLT